MGVLKEIMEKKKLNKKIKDLESQLEIKEKLLQQTYTLLAEKTNQLNNFENEI